jgi:hypothetical protein
MLDLGSRVRRCCTSSRPRDVEEGRTRTHAWVEDVDVHLAQFSSATAGTACTKRDGPDVYAAPEIRVVPAATPHLSSLSSRLSHPPSLLPPHPCSLTTLTTSQPTPSPALRHRQRPHLGRGGGGDCCCACFPLCSSFSILCLSPLFVSFSWLSFPSVPASLLRSHKESLSAGCRRIRTLPFSTLRKGVRGGCF